MRAVLTAELRRLAGHWSLWTILAATPVAGVLMLPINADLYLKYIYDDPQGLDQDLDAYRNDVLATYTSGLGWAQLGALLVGAVLVLRDRRLVGREPLEHPAAVVPLLAAKAVAAALAGLLVAAADLVAVLPKAHAHLAQHWAVPELTAAGRHELTLADRPVWTAVACAAVIVSTSAVLGVGLAAAAGRWRLPAGVVIVYTMAAWLYLVTRPGTDLISGVTEEIVGLLVLALGFLALPWMIVCYLLLTGHGPAAVTVMLVITVMIVLPGAHSATRRLSKVNLRGSCS
jgi:hypothetical protein